MSQFSPVMRLDFEKVVADEESTLSEGQVHTRKECFTKTESVPFLACLFTCALFIVLVCFVCLFVLLYLLSICFVRFWGRFCLFVCLIASLFDCLLACLHEISTICF